MTAKPLDVLVEARELLAKATPRPWKAYPARDGDSWFVARDGGEVPAYGSSITGWGCVQQVKPDAELIARAPELIKALADEVEALRKRLGRLKRYEEAKNFGDLMTTDKLLTLGEVGEIEKGARLDQCGVRVSQAVPNCFCRRPAGHVGFQHSESVQPNDVFWIHPAISALCRTVRGLQQANKDLAKDCVGLTNAGHDAHDRWQSELRQTEARLKMLTEDHDSLTTQLVTTLQERDTAQAFVTRLTIEKQKVEQERDALREQTGETEMIMRIEGGVCYTHGPYTSGGQCPFFPNCNDPKDEFIRMGNARVYEHNKKFSQADLDKAVDDFRTKAINLCREKAAEWQSTYDTDASGDHDGKVYYAKAARELAKQIEEMK